MDIKTKLSIRLDRHRNDALTEWVNNSFRTELERSVAWATFAYICNEYPAAREIIKGDLVESEFDSQE